MNEKSEEKNTIGEFHSNLVTEALPPIDGNYERPKARSTDRHKRETAFKRAVEANKMSGAHYSVATWRRLMFTFNFGSPEIKQALDAKKLSISRAVNIVKAEQDEKARQRLHEYLKLTEEERQKVSVEEWFLGVRKP